MPFGVKSAGEVFQKKNKEVFSGIPGIHIVAEDIIIAASSCSVCRLVYFPKDSSSYILSSACCSLILSE